MKTIRIALLLALSSFIACQPTQSKFDKLGLEEATIKVLHENYKNGTYTAKDVVEAYLERIEEYDQNGPNINSVITVNPDAIAIAEELDRKMEEGNMTGALHGIPVLLKDNIDTKDKMANTAGSRVMEGSMPVQDAYIV